MYNPLKKWKQEGVLWKGCYRNTLTGIKADKGFADKLLYNTFKGLF